MQAPAEAEPDSNVAPGSATNEVFDLAESPSSDDLPQLKPIAPPHGRWPTGPTDASKPAINPGSIRQSWSRRSGRDVRMGGQRSLW